MKIDKNYSITIGVDGNRWFALMGPNLHEGEVGFGITLHDALRALADDIEKIHLETFLRRIDALEIEDGDLC